MLNKDISSYSSIFSKDYTELRVQENRSINITLLNGDIVSNDSSAKSETSKRKKSNHKKDANRGLKIGIKCIKNHTARSHFKVLVRLLVDSFTAYFLAALFAKAFLGALDPVYFLAVYFVLAIL